MSPADIAANNWHICARVEARNLAKTGAWPVLMRCAETFLPSVRAACFVALAFPRVFAAANENRVCTR